VKLFEKARFLLVNWYNIKQMQVNETKLRQKIGASLQKARKAKRYTQEEVAESAGLTTNYYATLERGEAMASIETMYKLFAVLGINASDVFPERA
jgi:DNA-binding XRE family transcriptional regulator